MDIPKCLRGPPERLAHFDLETASLFREVLFSRGQTLAANARRRFELRNATPISEKKTLHGASLWHMSGRRHDCARARAIPEGRCYVSNPRACKQDLRSSEELLYEAKDDYSE